MVDNESDTRDKSPVKEYRQERNAQLNSIVHNSIINLYGSLYVNNLKS